MIHILFLLLLTALYFSVDSLSTKHKRRNRIIAMAFILFLFASLRSTNVGIDVPGYAESYESLYAYDFEQIFELMEGRDPCFYIFMKLLHFINPSPQMMLVTIGAIVAISFAYFVYYQDGNDLLLFILFITLRLYPFTLTGLRQAIALSLCWIAFVKLQKGKNVFFFVLTLLAMCFHLSAVSFLFLLALYKWGKPILISIISLAITIADTVTGHFVLRYISEHLAGDRFDGYLDENELTGFSSGGTFLVYVLFFIIIIFALMFARNNINNLSKYSKMFSISCITLMLVFLSQSIPVFFRISYYYMLPFYASISPGINALFKSKHDRFIIYVLVITLLCTQYIWLTPGAGINDYTFFWQIN